MAITSLFPGLDLKSLFSLFKKEDRFLGVDIGSSSIKIVQLKKEKERAILETYGELSLAGYANGDVGKAFVVIDTKITEALSDILKESKAGAKSAEVSLPLKNSFLTTMEMPYLSEEELKEAIPFEARKYVPIPLSEAKIDWWILPPKSEENAVSSIGSPKRKFVSVLLAAVPQEITAKYKSIFKNVNVEINNFELEVFPFARAALHRELGAVLLLDLGASSTKMIIADGGAVRAAHSLDKGSQEMTLNLSQSLGLNFERAEILKRENGILHKPETEGVASILETQVEFIAYEAERFLLDWKRRGGRPISKIVLGGGGALLKGITETMIKKFGVEAETVNPFSKVVYPAFLEPSLREVGATFTNAIGLALKNF